MLISDTELRAFTGYRRPGKQIAWLRKYGLRFFIAADGHPRVLRTDLDTAQKQRFNIPDFAALKKAG